MRMDNVCRLILSMAVLLIIFSINIPATSAELDKTFNFRDDGTLHTKDLSPGYGEILYKLNNKMLLAREVGLDEGKPSGENVAEAKKEEVKKTPQSTKKPEKEESSQKSGPVQYCQGKYKKMSSTGVEFITVKCPSVENTCTCDLDIKGFREWVDCGGVRKPSSKGSDFVECSSVIVGN